MHLRERTAAPPPNVFGWLEWMLGRVNDKSRGLIGMLIGMLLMLPFENG